MPEKAFVPNTVNIPTALHRIAKVEAAKEGVTLQAWIIEAMKLRAGKMETIIGRVYQGNVPVLFPESQVGNRWQEFHDLLLPNPLNITVENAKTDFKNPLYVETSRKEKIEFRPNGDIVLVPTALP